jgi:NADPH:quinone reductase-like Zn-dependent oxidoreductase
MKAAFLTGFGGNEVVKCGDLPEPMRSDDAVLVEVHAAGVNPVEVVIRQGLFAALPANHPIIMGFDMSGIVLEAPGGSEFKPGDDVYGRLPTVYGAYAERIAIPAKLLARKPKTVSHQEAASLPTVALTTWQRTKADILKRRGSMRALVVAYYGSAEYKALDKRTQGVRRRTLDKFCEKQ